MAITTLNNLSINRSDTAVADDRWTATSATASDFQALPASAGMWTKIVNKEITSSTASLEFVDGTGGVVFDSTYQYYMLMFRNYVGTVADRKMALEISLDTGVSWKSSGYEGYSYQSGYVDSKRLSYTYSMIATQEMGIVAGEGAFGFIMLENPSQTKLPTSLYLITQGQNSQDPQGYNYVGGGTYMTSTAYDGIRITTSGGSGAIETVEATLWGATDQDKIMTRYKLRGYEREPLTAAEEIAEDERQAQSAIRREAEKAAEDARLASKASGKQKLKDIGLDDDEIKALTGA